MGLVSSGGPYALTKLSPCCWERCDRSRLLGLYGGWRLLQDAVDQTPGDRLLAAHVVVPVDVALDLLARPAAVADVELDDQVALLQDLAGLDVDVRRLALDAGAPRLVDHDPGVGQREALAWRAAGQQDRGRAGRHARAERADVRADELHRVVDRQARIGRAAGA